MNYYPKQISARFSNPTNIGQLESANVIGTNATFVCGSALRFLLEIKEQKIVKVVFQTNGCGFLIAAADFLAEIFNNKTLSELKGLEDLGVEIEKHLGVFPESRRHCRQLAVQTLQDAFNNFRSAALEEWTGEKALICTCFGVSEETIEKIIIENNCNTVEDVSQKCNAGTGCGSCQPLIQEIIDSTSDML